MTTLLIDGYNLIPAVPLLGRLIRRDVKKAREALIDLLSSYASALFGMLRNRTPRS